MEYRCPIESVVVGIVEASCDNATCAWLLSLNELRKQVATVMKQVLTTHPQRICVMGLVLVVRLEKGEVRVLADISLPLMR